MSHNQRDTVRRYLSDALRDELDSHSFKQFLATMSEDPDDLVNRATHQLTHFIADADLRSADVDYDRLSREAIRKYLVELRA